MALSVTSLSSPLGARMVEQTVANATANNNVTGAASTLFLVEVDNAANTSAVFLKLYDALSPTVGTTAANHVFSCPASLKRQWAIPSGVAFATAISLACVTGAAEANATSPINPVVVRLVTS